MRVLPTIVFECVCVCGQGCDLIGTVGDESVIAEAGANRVLERYELFSEVTYHYVPVARADSRDNYTFLFGSCPTDCSERLEQSGFAPDSEHFAFRIGHSSRYDSGTRLLLFSFQGETVRQLLDKTDQTVTGYRFTDSTLVYTLGSGAVQSVPLD